MDNLTQGVIGGSLYTLITGKHTNKNFLLGAGIANIPDLDVFIARLLPLSPLDAQFFHRGIMHSIIFNVGVALALGYVLYRSDKTVSYWRYVIGVFVSIVCGHLLIDGMTSYGMRYWLPFSGKTYSTDNIFVVDLGMWIVTISGLIGYMISQAKQKIAKYIVIAVGIYFSCTFLIQGYVTQIFESHYPQRGVPIKIIDAKTLAEPLQPFLWRHVIKSSLGFYEGYYSIFDTNKDIKREFVPSHKAGEQIVNDLMVLPIPLADQLAKVKSFSRDMLRITTQGSGYMVENMLFGPLGGRKPGQQERMFNFDLLYSGDSYVLVQSSSRRGGLTSDVWNEFWKRVFGGK